MKAITPNISRRMISSIVFSRMVSAPALAYSGNPMTEELFYAANYRGCDLASGACSMHFNQAIMADLRTPGLEATYKHNDALLLSAFLRRKMKWTNGSIR